MARKIQLPQKLPAIPIWAKNLAGLTGSSFLSDPADHINERVMLYKGMTSPPKIHRLNRAHLTPYDIKKEALLTRLLIFKPAREQYDPFCCNNRFVVTGNSEAFVRLNLEEIIR
jgi:hypothetical protein